MRRLDLFGGSYGHARIVLLARNRSGHPAAITFYVCPAQAFGKRTAGNNGVQSCCWIGDPACRTMLSPRCQEKSNIAVPASCLGRTYAQAVSPHCYAGGTRTDISPPLMVAE